MHSQLLFSAATALALSSGITHASPLQAPRQQDTSQPLSLADTFFFIAKTIGSNPNPSVLPDVNNWNFAPVHEGATENLVSLTDPSIAPRNFSSAGYFRNGTISSAPYLNSTTPSPNIAITVGNIAPNYPLSLVLSQNHQINNTDPEAEIGVLWVNEGYGTTGLDVTNGKLTDATGSSQRTWACPGVMVEGGEGVAVVVSNGDADAPLGCWQIEFYAQCGGAVSEDNKARYPGFVQTRCFVEATEAVGSL